VKVSLLVGDPVKQVRKVKLVYLDLTEDQDSLEKMDSQDQLDSLACLVLWDRREKPEDEESMRDLVVQESRDSLDKRESLDLVDQDRKVIQDQKVLLECPEVQESKESKAHQVFLLVNRSWEIPEFQVNVVYLDCQVWKEAGDPRAPEDLTASQDLMEYRVWRETQDLIPE